ncbi:hypothetical protein NEMIN01_2355 [Nematocida minor]|uniref:uncharacterized protein n=1 Tax=Nematocida minor TaxID=1912983 RepID=UPI00221EAC76|nr:uncharacterized protein NEMIN01_2355 [Nematocida minor]KAI5193011.1 hypothetical protein NEMIN01_2355 [Nematocida minor]
MKEVKLKIKLEEIRKACELAIQRATIKGASGKDNVDILKRIFDRNIEIEGPCTDKEREGIENTIKNNACLYFTYNTYGTRIMDYVSSALESKDELSIRYWYISLFNEIIKPNLLIYSPEHGIHIQVDKSRALDNIGIASSNPDLSTREYTLQLDDAKLLSLESTLHVTDKSLERESLLYIAESIASMKLDVLKKYSSEKAQYSVNRLYTKKYENTSVPLVDYGLNLIHEKYHEVKELVEEIKGLEYDDGILLVDTKLEKIFTKEEDVELVLSVISNIERIKNEKTTQKGIIDTVEYMANNTELLKERENEPNTLKINTDLSNFKEDYIVKTGLKNIVFEKKDKISKEIEGKKENLEVRKKNMNKQ